MVKMTPAGIEFADDAPLKVETVLSLRQSPQQVWDVLVDNEGWPRWFRSCKAAHTTSEPGVGVGSTRWAHVDQFKVNHRFVVWDEPRQLGFTNLDANLPIADTVVELITLEGAADGTQLTYTFAVALKRWLRPLTPVFRWQFTRLFRRSLDGLQPHLDSIQT
jgi:uncharacterized protein YndB with AHSA1/START domain